MLTGWLLSSQVDELSKEVSEAKRISKTLIFLYCSFVSSFGGRVEAPEDSVPVSGLLSWMSGEIGALSEFVHRATDFAALSSANNLLSSLYDLGCQHFQCFLKKSFEFKAPDPNKEGIREIKVGAKRFIRDFWVKFGREDARRLVDARTAEVGFACS